jgi:hypothetical protein
MKKAKKIWKAWALTNQFGDLRWVSNNRDEKPVKPGVPGNRHYRVVKVVIKEE